MKKFSFSLEPLLKIRKIKENEEYRKLSEIVGKINSIQDEISYFQNEINKESEYLLEKIKGKISIQDYNFYAQVTKSLELKIQELQNEIKQMEPDLELAKIRLIQARKDKRVIEILKEKAYQEFQKKLKKEEKKELYEILIAKQFFEAEEKEIQPPPSQPEFSYEWELDSIWDYEDEVSIDEQPKTELEKLKEFYDERFKNYK